MRVNVRLLQRRERELIASNCAYFSILSKAGLKTSRDDG